ncbi:MAG: glycosyltransferase family 39 protein [Anaerolineae bacterium]|nr:glycosyltransferase family 39 protein [Anaerolineae bacterium]
MYIMRGKPYLTSKLIISALFVFFTVGNLLRIEFEVSLQHNDGWWYLNRAWLHSHGIFDEVSFYTLAYPLLVGAVNWLTSDLVSAALVANALSQLLLLIGIYILGRRLVNHSVGLLSVFLFALSPGNLFHARFFNADLLFVAVSVWIVALAIQLAEQPSKPLACITAVLLAVMPFIRTEGAVYSLVILAAFVAMRLHGRTWRSIIGYALVMTPIVGLMWLGYFIWFLSGADAVSGVNDALPLAYQFEEQRWLFQLRRTLELLDWQLNRSDWIALLAGFLALRARIPSRLVLLLPILLLIFAYITFVSPMPHSRYAFQLTPYLVVILGALLATMMQRFPLSIITGVALVSCVHSAFTTLQKLPMPLAYRDDSRVIEFRQVADELAHWRQVNGYENATIYTTCTDLMIFAQYDLRLPYTTLLFSSRRFAPPEQVLPQIAERDSLLLVCPSFIGDLYSHPFNTEWTRLYRYWSGVERDNPELADMARYPLEEVGRVREYIIYRVKPKMQSAQ